MVFDYYYFKIKKIKTKKTEKNVWTYNLCFGFYIFPFIFQLNIFLFFLLNKHNIPLETSPWKLLRLYKCPFQSQILGNTSSEKRETNKTIWPKTPKKVYAGFKAAGILIPLPHPLYELISFLKLHYPRILIHFSITSIPFLSLFSFPLIRVPTPIYFLPKILIL